MPMIANQSPFSVAYSHNVSDVLIFDFSDVSKLSAHLPTPGLMDLQHFTGGYLFWVNDTDFTLYGTFNNSGHNCVLTPGMVHACPLNAEDSAILWTIHGKNPYQVHPQAILHMLYLTRADIQSGHLIAASGLANPSTPAASIGPGALPEGVTIGADDVTAETFGAGVLLPATQVTAGTFIAGVIEPAAQVGAGTFGAGVIEPAAQVGAGVLANTVVAQQFGPSLAGSFNAVDSAGSHFTEIVTPQPAGSARSFRAATWDGAAAHGSGDIVDTAGNRLSDRLISSLVAVYLDVTNTASTDDVKVEGAGATAKDLQLFGWDGATQHVGVAAIQGGGAKLYTSLGDRGIQTKDNGGSAETATFGPAATAIDYIVSATDASAANHVVLKAPGVSQVVQLGTDDAGTKRLVQEFIGTTDPAGRTGITVGEGDRWYNA